MYQFGSETGELRKIYNFGNTSENTSAPANTSQLPESPTHLEDVREYSDDGERESPAENRQNTYEGETELQVPLQASAFAPDNSNASGNEMDYKFSSGGKVSNEKEKKDSSKKKNKLNVAKEVLGLNKKSTKGLTPAEKERVLLEERWANAIAEERRLNALEVQVTNREQATNEANLAPNFPPKFLCIKPFVHHDFEVVPEPRRSFVKLNFLNWIVTCILIIINMTIAIGVVSAPYRAGAEKRFKIAQSNVLAVVYLIGMPLSFIIWYWQIYCACSTGRNTKHILSLIGLIVALAFSIFMFVGRSNYGACGIDLAIDISETKNKFLVIPVIIVLSLWGLEAVFLCYCIVRQWIFYRLDINAQQEARRHLRNIIGV